MLQSISGPNYTSSKVHLLDPECHGEACPGSFDRGTYFIEEIGPCQTSEDALASPQGPEEYCRLSPNMTAFGIEFVFNNLLDPTSIELVRRRPDNPQLFEVYDWKTQVLQIEGPITRFNGDYFAGRLDAPDRVTRAVNLSCIDNLAAQGVDFSHTDYEDPQTNPCNRLDPQTGRPMKMQTEGVVKAARGLRDSRAMAMASNQSCDSPEDGPDACCNQCDLLLSTRVAKYGVRTTNDPGSGAPLSDDRLLARDNLRNPHDGSALACDPEGDVFAQCRDFQVGVSRQGETLSLQYFWSCDPAKDAGCTRDTHAVPYYDRLRALHPDDRPAFLERRSTPCTSSAQCDAPGGLALTGTQCVGVDDRGQACAMDAAGEDSTCAEGRCRAPWFVTCRADAETTGAQGYCVDRRFDDRGAGACLRARTRFSVCEPSGDRCGSANAGTVLAYCDRNGDNLLSAQECCQSTLGGEVEAGVCDPLLQSQLAPVARYTRNGLLPEATRDCVCTDLGRTEAKCREAVLTGGCVDDDGNVRPDRDGDYAVKFVTRRGGVIYDPAIKGFEVLPADLGAVPRAAIEDCAQRRGLIPARSIEDGWRAHDAFDSTAESFEDFDRAMCSGSRYTVRFAEPDAEHPREVVADKLGNTLQGKSEYVFETPQFRVVPGSGFPTENLRIGACDDFRVRLTNKYDLSPENLAKVMFFAVDEAGALLEPAPGCGVGTPLAGGPDCATTDAERKARGMCTPPCLTVDVRNQPGGELRVRIDPVEFGRVMETGKRYRLWVPGLTKAEEISDPDAYAAAFWDACGMPLVLGSLEQDVEYTYDFGVDEPKCKEDRDGDDVPLSCDNAHEIFNPDQLDLDVDGVGDVVDLCPTVPGTANSADSDRDGIGNACDNCRQTVEQYNKAADATVVAGMRVRNIPLQHDTDGDGIGDACDNCVRVANCQGYDLDSPWSAGDPIAYDDANLCQRDDDRDLIGDACAGDRSDSAAGPVGLGPGDDFDQDGLANAVDGCPRQPVDRLGAQVSCSSDADCPTGSKCEKTDPKAAGVCDHRDSDGDKVGDICDTCPAVPNPMQVLDGAAQEDDADGDFIGRDCEAWPQCADRSDARAYTFYEVAAGGYCCTTQLVQTEDGLANSVTGKALVDPDGLPVTLDCSDADETSGLCRPLPDFSRAAPGVVAMPPGCDEALAEAGYASPQDNPKLTLRDTDGDLDALWKTMCLLPQRDQDFDAVGDACDLCMFDFDPTNRAYTDANGKLWPKAGAFCNGEYDIEKRCADEDDPATGTGTGDGGSDDAASSSGGSGTEG